MSASSQVSHMLILVKIILIFFVYLTLFSFVGADNTKKEPELEQFREQYLKQRMKQDPEFKHLWEQLEDLKRKNDLTDEQCKAFLEKQKTTDFDKLFKSYKAHRDRYEYESFYGGMACDWGDIDTQNWCEREAEKRDIKNLIAFYRDETPDEVKRRDCFWRVFSRFPSSLDNPELVRQFCKTTPCPCETIIELEKRWKEEEKRKNHK